MHVGSLHVHAPPPPRAPPKYPVVQGSSLEADNNTLKQVDQLMVYVDNMEREYVRRFSKIDEMMENYRDFVANVQKHNKIFKCLLCLVNYNVSIGEMKLPPGSETILSREVVWIEVPLQLGGTRPGRRRKVSAFDARRLSWAQ